MKLDSLEFDICPSAGSTFSDSRQSQIRHFLMFDNLGFDILEKRRGAPRRGASPRCRTPCPAGGAPPPLAVSFLQLGLRSCRRRWKGPR